MKTTACLLLVLLLVGSSNECPARAASTWQASVPKVSLKQKLNQAKHALERISSMRTKAPVREIPSHLSDWLARHGLTPLDIRQLLTSGSLIGGLFAAGILTGNVLHHALPSPEIAFAQMQHVDPNGIAPVHVDPNGVSVEKMPDDLHMTTNHVSVVPPELGLVAQAYINPYVLPPEKALTALNVTHDLMNFHDMNSFDETKAQVSQKIFDALGLSRTPQHVLESLLPYSNLTGSHEMGPFAPNTGISLSSQPTEIGALAAYDRYGEALLRSGIKTGFEENVTSFDYAKAAAQINGTTGPDQMLKQELKNIAAGLGMTRWPEALIVMSGGSEPIVVEFAKKEPIPLHVETTVGRAIEDFIKGWKNTQDVMGSAIYGNGVEFATSVKENADDMLRSVEPQPKQMGPQHGF